MWKHLVSGAPNSVGLGSPDLLPGHVRSVPSDGGLCVFGNAANSPQLKDYFVIGKPLCIQLPGIALQLNAN